MNKKGTPIIILAVIAIFVILQAFFTVDETEVAIVTTFGEFKQSHTSPGLKMKTPFVDSVTKFDKRLQRVDVPPEALLTSDKKRLTVDAYARYKIINPLVFFKNLTNESTADSRIASIVASKIREEIAQDTQEEIISAKRENVMANITTMSNLFEISLLEAQALENGLQNTDLFMYTKELGQNYFTLADNNEIASILSGSLDEKTEIKYYLPLQNIWGVEVFDVRIKRADFPDSVENSIFERMVAERFRKASAFRAEGEEQDKEIRAAVDREVEITLETAKGQSAITRGEGEALAIDALADALKSDPEFYGFVRSLEAYEKSLANDTTVILDPESELFKYLEKYSK
ncbi:MAG: HflC protein [Chloroflexi bacterium]|nr:HflC protein [Chloroflexota bacterium]|tara:strand:- start:5931 stop:6968 length:1038 start_codon:yes stop_codon:yes gene_type:complete